MITKSKSTQNPQISSLACQSQCELHVPAAGNVAEVRGWLSRPQLPRHQPPGDLGLATTQCGP